MPQEVRVQVVLNVTYDTLEWICEQVGSAPARDPHARIAYRELERVRMQLTGPVEKR